MLFHIIGKAFIASLEAIGQSPMILIFWLLTVVLLTVRLWRQGSSGMADHIKKTLESIGIAVVAWLPFFFWSLGYEARRSEEPTKSSHLLTGFLQISGIAPVDSVIAVGKTLSFNYEFKNRGTQPIHDARTFAGIFTIQGTPSIDDELTIAPKLSKIVKEQYEHAPRSKSKEGAFVGVEQGLIDSIEIHPTEADVTNLLNGRSRLFLSGWATWKDAEGYDGRIDVCQWLRPESNKLQMKSMMWHLCM